MIPAEAVEALMDAAHDSGFVLKRSLAHDWLEVAAPHIRAQMLEEVAAEVDEGVPAHGQEQYADWLRSRAESERGTSGNH